jgi:hypothetical protein
MENKKKSKLFYWLIAFACLLVFGLGVKGCIAIGSMTYSEGERTGTITKFSHRGMVIKTWEGELNMGGFDQGGVASTWAFSVDDPAIVEKIHQAQREGGRWTLKYRQQFSKQSWRGATDYFIVDVIKVNN